MTVPKFIEIRQALSASLFQTKNTEIDDVIASTLEGVYLNQNIQKTLNVQN